MNFLIPTVISIKCSTAKDTVGFRLIVDRYGTLGVVRPDSVVSQTL